MSKLTKLTVAIAGNPNCGKSALFNALTGSRQKVGNWSGVTVDRRTGWFKLANAQVDLIDLPGTYAANANSDALDEKIVCDYLRQETPDILLNIIDASNLQRNLYLTLQLLEMQIPMIVVLNMVDITEKRGLAIDTQALSHLLQCPVVTTVARQGKGLDGVKQAINQLAHNLQNCVPWQYTNNHLDDTISKTVEQISEHLIATEQQSPTCARRTSMGLLEGDAHIKNPDAVVQQQVNDLQKNYREELDIIIADQRYAFINTLYDQVVSLQKSHNKKTLTQKIDQIILHRFWGIPIFFGVMYLMFFFAINIGGAFQDFFDISSSTLFVEGMSHWLNQLHSPNWLIAILANGIGTGINTIVTFTPIIAGMFLFLAFLEDSGYMTRAAFVMDRLMRALGLPGKSFVPMIVGFGCNVPAVMGARTLAHRRDRILTILMMPFMACSARLAIFAVFASAFFPVHGALVIFSLYILGIVVAVLSGLLLRKSLLPGKTEPLVMELPPYHVPLLNALGKQAWWRTKQFVFRAGKAIVPICVLIGSLNAITVTGQLKPAGSQDSLLSAAGRLVTPVFAPIGVHQENWQATVGLATGVLAKEVVVGTLNTLYSQSTDSSGDFDLWGNLKTAVYSIPENLNALSSALLNPVAANEAPHDMSKTAFGTMIKQFINAKAAYAYLLFVLLYFPCVATMAAIRRAIGRGWAYFSVLWNTGSAYILSVLCYQLLSLPQHPLSSSLWSIGALAVLTVSFIMMRHYANSDAQTKSVNGVINKNKIALLLAQSSNKRGKKSRFAA